MTQPQGTVRLNINLSQNTATDLKNVAARDGASITETVKKAIFLAAFFEDEKEKGRKIRTMTMDERDQREVIFIS